MTRPIELYQDADQIITVNMNEDISTATEVEFLIDAPTQISKTLSDNQVYAVTSASFKVRIDAADTASLCVGSYKYQARATIGGKKYNIKFTPNKIKVMDSVFVDDGYRANDYN